MESSNENNADDDSNSMFDIVRGRGIGGRLFLEIEDIPARFPSIGLRHQCYGVCHGAITAKKQN